MPPGSKQPAVVGHDVDPLPAGVEQLSDPRDDPLDLLVEVVDKPDAHVVAAVVELAGFGPAVPRRDRRSRSVRATCTPCSAMSDRRTWIVAFVPVAALAACSSGPAFSAPVATGRARASPSA